MTDEPEPRYYDDQGNPATACDDLMYDPLGGMFSSFDVDRVRKELARLQRERDEARKLVTSTVRDLGAMVKEAQAKCDALRTAIGMAAAEVASDQNDIPGTIKALYQKAVAFDALQDKVKALVAVRDDLALEVDTLRNDILELAPNGANAYPVGDEGVRMALDAFHAAEIAESNRVAGLGPVPAPPAGPVGGEEP